MKFYKDRNQVSEMTAVSDHKFSRKTLTSKHQKNLRMCNLHYSKVLESLEILLVFRQFRQVKHGHETKAE